MFSSMASRFIVWVQTPDKAAHIVETPDEVIEFLLHEDGANLKISYHALKEHTNNPDNWVKNNDGMFFQWSIQVGFTAVFLLVVTPLPTLLEQKCLWCGNTHKGGPEFCC